MKNGKVAGNEEVIMELLKNVDEHKSANNALIQMKCSKDFNRKLLTNKPSHWYYKIFTKLINNAIQNTVDSGGQEKSFSKEYEIPMSLASIDFKKAFESLYPRAINQGVSCRNPGQYLQGS